MKLRPESSVRANLAVNSFFLREISLKKLRWKNYFPIFVNEGKILLPNFQKLSIFYFRETKKSSANFPEFWPKSTNFWIIVKYMTGILWPYFLVWRLLTKNREFYSFFILVNLQIACRQIRHWDSSFFHLQFRLLLGFFELLKNFWSRWFFRPLRFFLQ